MLGIKKVFKMLTRLEFVNQACNKDIVLLKSLTIKYEKSKDNLKYIISLIEKTIEFYKTMLALMEKMENVTESEEYIKFAPQLLKVCKPYQKYMSHAIKVYPILGNLTHPMTFIPDFTKKNTHLKKRIASFTTNDEVEGYRSRKLVYYEESIPKANRPHVNLERLFVSITFFTDAKCHKSSMIRTRASMVNSVSYNLFNKYLDAAKDVGAITFQALSNSKVAVPSWNVQFTSFEYNKRWVNYISTFALGDAMIEITYISLLSKFNYSSMEKVRAFEKALAKNLYEQRDKTKDKNCCRCGRSNYFMLYVNNEGKIYCAECLIELKHKLIAYKMNHLFQDYKLRDDFVNLNIPMYSTNKFKLFGSYYTSEHEQSFTYIKRPEEFSTALRTPCYLMIEVKICIQDVPPLSTAYFFKGRKYFAMKQSLLQVATTYKGKWIYFTITMSHFQPTKEYPEYKIDNMIKELKEFAFETSPYILDPVNVFKHEVAKVDTCSLCGVHKNIKKLYNCRCRNGIKYCSLKCQRRHWKSHKSKCCANTMTNCISCTKSNPTIRCKGCKRVWFCSTCSTKSSNVKTHQCFVRDSTHFVILKGKKKIF